MVGKRIGGDLYLHKTSICFAQSEHNDLIKEFEQRLEDDDRNWNVVRFSNENIAFLTYQNFDETAFPELRRSTRFDLLSGQKSVRDFSQYENPPILHRKELLLPEDHPDFSRFRRITAQLDEIGLFYGSHTIGYKKQWESRLISHGVSVVGHELEIRSLQDIEQVERHRTALVRYQLSQPMQLLLRHNILSENVTVFDYGCGRGDDVATLNAAGFSALGWDPHFAPENKKVVSDVVNIGFVLNVIEDLGERRKALTTAWGLAKKVLSVAVMSPGSASLENAKPYKDGFLTSRKTFQKYFSQEQLKSFISEVLNIEPVAVATGIFFVFKDEIALQEYQINRYARNVKISSSFSSQRQQLQRTPKFDRMEKSLPNLRSMADIIMQVGRAIHSDELPDEIIDSLKLNNIGLNAAQQYCLENLCPSNELHQIGSQRKEDLRLYFALEFFSHHKPYRELPKKLQYDLRHFWGGYLNAQISAKELLFSIGNEALLRRAANDAVADGLGNYVSNEQFQFHRSILDRLPIILRCFVSCASILFGNLDDVDVIKIHLNTKKITLLFFENFEDFLPILKTRHKLDLRTQEISTFNYDDANPNYLYMKSLFIPKDYDGYREQSEFDLVLANKSGLNFDGYGPAARDLEDFLRKLEQKSADI